MLVATGEPECAVTFTPKRCAASITAWISSGIINAFGKTASVGGYSAGNRYLDPFGPGGDLCASSFYQFVRPAEFFSAFLFRPMTRDYRKRLAGAEDTRTVRLALVYRPHQGQVGMMQISRQTNGCDAGLQTLTRVHCHAQGQRRLTFAVATQPSSCREGQDRGERACSSGPGSAKPPSTSISSAPSGISTLPAAPIEAIRSPSTRMTAFSIGALPSRSTTVPPTMAVVPAAFAIRANAVYR